MVFSKTQRLRLRNVVTETRYDFSKELDHRGYVEPTNLSPFKDSDVLTVYHGFNELEDALVAAQKGLSGKDFVARRYSYEQNNNPRGLFVTLSRKIADRFAGHHKASAIIEFNVRYGELESPVWPGGGYTVQGQASQSFSRRGDRVKAIKDFRNTARQQNTGDWSAIGGSERPEVAHTLFRNAELQALFLGHLNPNRISRVWVREAGKGGQSSTSDPLKPYKRTAFLRKFSRLTDKKDRDTRRMNARERVFSPQDSWNETKFIQTMSVKHGLDHNEVISTFKWMAEQGTYNLKVELEKFVWPKQLPKAMRWATRR